MPDFQKIMFRRFLWTTAVELLVLVGAALLARFYGYLLFHSTVELFSVLVACAIFAIAWNCRFFMDNRYLLFVGIGFLFVGFLDLLHALAYKGMGVFEGQRPDLSIQLWIVSRAMQALTLLIALMFAKRKWRPSVVMAAYGAVTALFCYLIFSGRFPVCYVEEVSGSGMLTSFKIIGEVVICFVLAAAMALIYQRRADFDPMVLNLLFLSMGLNIISEVAFTIYTNVYGPANLIGHIFKLGSYYFIYKAVIHTGLRRPFSLIFRSMKQSGDALRDANEQLELRSNELKQANEDLEAYARTVAHDLQNPLAAMRAFLWVLDQDLKSENLDSARHSAQKIQGVSERMASMIQNLLNLARVRHATLNREPIDLAAIAREISESLRGREPQRNAEILIPESLPAHGDPALLRVAVENLLDNAWKFSRDSAETRIEIGSSERDGVHTFFIRDNGIGFDPAQAANLFHTFQRLPGSEDYTGTGIGLASVRRIIERHGGRIWAESQPGKGACFYFTLGVPGSAGAPGAAGASSAAGAPNSSDSPGNTGLGGASEGSGAASPSAPSGQS